MKRIILCLLVAALSVAFVHAQETKKTIYVIDGKQVENFDGSQLVGKTIINYSINSNDNSIVKLFREGSKKRESSFYDEGQQTRPVSYLRSHNRCHSCRSR